MDREYYSLIDPNREPGTTSIPNVFIDELMFILGGSEFRVLYGLATLTLREGRMEATRSLSELSDLFKLSRTTVVSCFDTLERLGIVEVETALPGRRDANIYRFRDMEHWDWQAIDTHAGFKSAKNTHATRIRQDSQWGKLRRIVFNRDGFTCRYCQRHVDTPVCDHVIPVSQGGTNDLSNLVTACHDCNQSKHAKTADEWAAWKRQRGQ